MSPTTAVPSPLDTMLCFALYSASHATSQAYRALLAPWSLTYTQYLVLVLVADGDELSIGELGSRMRLDSGTLSPLIRRLEQRGLVSRERGTTDERVVTVSVTPSGRELYAELAEAVRCVAAGFQVDARSVPGIIGMLRGLTAGMQELTSASR